MPEQLDTITRVLVISDNAELAGFMLEEHSKQRLGKTSSLALRYSASNKSPGSLAALGATAIDLRDTSEIDAILADFDLVFSLHCKRIFPEKLVTGVRCVNFHPGYNPHNRGWYPQVFSILDNRPLGATVHVMTADIDAGPIITRREIILTDSDTSSSAYDRVIEAEKDLIRDHLASIISGEYKTQTPEQDGNYNSIADFKELCHLDLASVNTLEQHIKLLRALTHPPHQNAYYIDHEGRQVFVSLSLHVDKQ